MEKFGMALGAGSGGVTQTEQSEKLGAFQHLAFGQNGLKDLGLNFSDGSGLHITVYYMHS